jgi:hypothetical protein
MLRFGKMWHSVLYSVLVLMFETRRSDYAAARLLNDLTTVVFSIEAMVGGARQNWGITSCMTV